MSTISRRAHDSAPVSRGRRLGAGLGRMLDRPRGAWQGAGAPGAEAGTAATGPRCWGEGDAAGLGARLAPAAQSILEACGAGEGRSLVDLTAGDGAVAIAAAAAGWHVTAVERDPRLAAAGRVRCAEGAADVEWCTALPACARVAPRAFDAVVSGFVASHHVDPRRLARIAMGAANGGAPIAFTAWKGLMARVMSITAPERRGRSERWAHHETARLHLPGLPELSVRQHWMPWHFQDVEQAVRELAAPVGTEAAHRRLRAAMPDLVETYGLRADDGLALRSDYALVVARRS